MKLDITNVRLQRGEINEKEIEAGRRGGEKRRERREIFYPHEDKTKRNV